MSRTQAGNHLFSLSLFSRIKGVQRCSESARARPNGVKLTKSVFPLVLPLRETEALQGRLRLGRGKGEGPQPMLSPLSTRGVTTV